jgi:hypothetical protein
MNSWSELLNESQKQRTPANPNAGVQFLAAKKKDFIEELSRNTGRNTILYFSAFMHKPSTADASINDKDVNAFMENVHNMDRSKGLDLILHTPGGDLAATEQIIYYLRSAFNGDIRAIVPQMAMSAGSMIAVSCKSIVMGRQSCLGPFDPQLNGAPCQSIINEFYAAVKDVEEHPASLGLWQTIISKLTPAFITQCQQADKLASELTEMILSDKGFDSETKKRIKTVFSQNSDSKIHNRHIYRDKCKSVGLDIIDLEGDQKIQDLVLGIHHACMILSEQSSILKIVENNIGGSYLINVPMTPQTLPGPFPMPRR